MNSNEFYQAALEGLMAQRVRLDATIEEVEKALGNRKTAKQHHDQTLHAVPEKATRKKRKMSPGARARISAAQKKRWKSYHKEHAA